MGKKEVFLLANHAQISGARGLLPDAREIAIDDSLPPVMRLARFAKEVANPSVFRVGDAVVEVDWADTEVTLQERLRELLLLKC